MARDYNKRAGAKTLGAAIYDVSEYARSLVDTAQITGAPGLMVGLGAPYSSVPVFPQQQIQMQQQPPSFYPAPALIQQQQVPVQYQQVVQGGGRRSRAASSARTGKPPLQGAGVRGGGGSANNRDISQFLQQIMQQMPQYQQTQSAPTASSMKGGRGGGAGGGAGRVGRGGNIPTSQPQVSFAPQTPGPGPASFPVTPGKDANGRWIALAGGNTLNNQLCTAPACVRTAVCWRNHSQKA